MKILSNSKLLWFFPKNIYGFTLGQTIYLRKHESDYEPYKINHEKIHVAQYKDIGVFKFLFDYFIKQMFVPYRKKWQEIEAYKNERNLNYLNVRGNKS